MFVHQIAVEAGTICTQCLRNRIRQHRLSTCGRFSSLAAAPSRSTFAKQYFWGNDLRSGVHASDEVKKAGKHVASCSSDPSSSKICNQLAIGARDASRCDYPHSEQPVVNESWPYRRRRRRRGRRKVEDTPESHAETEKGLPPDASSQLSLLSSRFPSNTLRQRLLAFLSLSKPRLTFLIVLTTTASYSLFPVAVSPMASSVDLSPLTLLTLTTGTGLASASANAFNMLLEPAHDAKMSRTRTRPLVRGLLTSRAALVFAISTGIAGTALLNYGVNPTTAFLGGANIFIYAGIYTPLKRLSVLNTWAGAIVGGIPPLMGWAAAAGQATPYADATWRDLLIPPDGSSAGGWLLAALLFAWQFPHFWALAYPIRHEYAAAGYRMLVSSNVSKTARISLRYSLLMFPICAGLSAVNVTSWAFVPASGVVNAWLVRESWRYLRHEGAKGSARGLFWASVWHLPVILALAMIMKKGLWERIVQGGLDEDELRAWQAGDVERIPQTKLPPSDEREHD